MNVIFEETDIFIGRLPNENRYISYYFRIENLFL